MQYAFKLVSRDGGTASQPDGPMNISTMASGPQNQLESCFVGYGQQHMAVIPTMVISSIVAGNIIYCIVL
jgi:hypothetical protein